MCIVCMKRTERREMLQNCSEHLFAKSDRIPKTCFARDEESQEAEWFCDRCKEGISQLGLCLLTVVVLPHLFALWETDVQWDTEQGSSKREVGDIGTEEIALTCLSDSVLTDEVTTGDEKWHLLRSPPSSTLSLSPVVNKCNLSTWATQDEEMKKKPKKLAISRGLM